MALLKKYWRTILIGILLVVVGILLTLNCRRSDTTSYQGREDSLVRENKSLNRSLGQFNDSIASIVKKRDETQLALSKKLENITQKYIALRNSHPSHDTIVKDSIVYLGNECLEKLPIVEQQRDNCISEVATLKVQVMRIDDGNKQLQKQFESLVAVSKDQSAAMKKLDRKRKWNKVWAVSATIATIGVLTATLVVQ